MKHILAEHKARNVATSQEHEDDPEFDSPASGENLQCWYVQPQAFFLLFRQLGTL